MPPDGACHDLRFTDFPDLLRAGDLLVFNDTRVIPARVHGVKPTGGQVEILLERVLGGNRILAHVHASKPLRPDAPVALPGGVEARYIGRHEDLFELEDEPSGQPPPSSAATADETVPAAASAASAPARRPPSRRQMPQAGRRLSLVFRWH